MFIITYNDVLMRDIGVNMDIFPSNKVLEQAILDILMNTDGLTSVQEMNLKVVELLSLPDDIVNLEDENGVDTKLNYRLRWCRTNLKNKNKIENVKKGFWKYVGE